MSPFAYLFERFPSFGQTFCYREVAEIYRQGLEPPIFAIREPKDEPPQDWDRRIVERVDYVPEEAALVSEVDRLLKRRKVSDQIVDLVKEWGRRTDFLRLYQAIYVGVRLQEKGIRHVHAHFAAMAARTAFWINKFFGITFSFTGHANDIFSPGDFEIGLPKLMNSANAIVTVSDYGADFLKQQFPVDAGKIHRVYNGLDLGKFKRANFSGSTPSIVAVGRLIEKKGFGDLIRACQALEKRGCKFHCSIIGEGPLENNLREQIEQAGLQLHVILTGPLPQQQIIEQLAAGSVFVLPCVAEQTGAKDNLPTVIMEAMAAGLPVISTPIGGVPEMVIENETGFLVQPNDATALANAIEKVVTDPEQARKLGDAGYERARQLFAIEKTVASLRKILL